MTTRVGTRFAEDLRPSQSTGNGDVPDGRVVGTFLLLGLFAAWTRFPGLDISLWWDEVSTAHHYVSRGPDRIFSPDSYLPNNHVLFSLLTWATSTVVGVTERMLRLWSLIPALAAVVVVAVWAWHRLGRWPAVGLAFLALTSPIHLELSPQARGYGLAFLAAAVMLTAASRVSEQRRLSDVAWWSAGGLLGILTIPTLTFLFSFHGLLLLTTPGRKIRAAVVAGFGVVGLTSLAFYWPLLPAILDETGGVGSRTGETPGLLQTVVFPFTLLIAPSAEDALSWLPNALVLTLAAVLTIVGAVTLARTRSDRPLLLHLVIPVVGTLAAMGIAGMHVRERYISFLLFHCLVLLVVGFTWFARQTTRRLSTPVPAATVLIGLALLATTASLRLADHLTTTPREDFKSVASVLGDEPPERIITNRHHPVGFQYYLGVSRSDLEMVEPEEAPAYVCEADPPFVFLDYPPRAAEPQDFSCLDRRGAVRIPMEQRIDELDVWILR